MTSWQKTVKYIALAFAIFLSISIISGICMALSSLTFLFGSKNNVGELTSYPIEGNVDELVIDISATDLTIHTDDNFRVDSNNEDLKINVSDGKLSISDEHKGFALNSKGVHLDIYIPKDMHFDSVDVDAGAGSVKIDELCADVLEIDLGAGEAQIDKLTADKSAKINSGAGELTINEGVLNNLEMDMGVGEVNLTGAILGKSKVDYGIGEANMTLVGTEDDYEIDLDKGIGGARLEGKTMKDDSVYGSGDNKIEIDGGIGEINITFQSQN